MVSLLRGEDFRDLEKGRDMVGVVLEEGHEATWVCCGGLAKLAYIHLEPVEIFRGEITYPWT